jgi:uncharacterized protein
MARFHHSPAINAIQLQLGAGLYCFFIMKKLLILLIDAYRLLLSPFFGTQCRFWPTCSAYAREAIDTHGAIKGTWLTVRRLGKCHPWHEGGIDNVPPARPEG